ncbi:MAG: sulfurtransferase TusA family protein [Cellulomonas sp.]|uniref:sulfurtransferase TusA family protein n=1 Tax=Cellulomonas sp. TaxID=40001 RepID=UPI001803B573|nr:sulfurtransferase TusA family protein [Cellulomonas sp.]NMM16112.1 sulfurtransferase TusA family protein [Cellulomonas sp.]NMM30115.1 sulfurtransferase TusA family protein [Cellulomonas sp.]
MADLIDARGLLCPIPVIRLARAAVDAVPGTVITIWATDPAARLDVPAWARMRGHEVVRVQDLPDGAVAMDVRIAAAPTATS